MTEFENLVREFMEMGVKMREMHVRLTPGIFKDELTASQWWALESIKRQPNITLSEFADKLSIAQSTASEFIDKLVRKKLVERNSPPEDRRKIVLSLTNKGEKVLTNYVEHHGKMFARLFSKLSDDDQKEFLVAMKTIHRITQEFLKLMEKEQNEK